jgi:hypothetical protein
MTTLLAAIDTPPLLVWTYVIYLAVSVALTIWVARTLHRNGRLFLVRAFHGDEQLADSINHLLVVGFYLVNIGWVTLALRYGIRVPNLAGVFETLSVKLGFVSVLLGGMHFLNLYLFNRMRHRATLDTAGPPVEADERIVLQ